MNDVKDYNYIEETSALFQALALRHVMLQEGRLDEAGIWDTVKGTVGGVMRGIKSADDAVNKLGSLVQQTKPVENFDTKVNEIVANIKSKLSDRAPKAVAAAERYAEWAKKNPIKQGLIIGALTAVAALAGGPGAAAAAGFILRSANEYMKGEKASTAIGRGVKTAAVGAGLSWLAGTTVDALKGAFEVAEPVLKQLPIGQLIRVKQDVGMLGQSIFKIDQTFPRDVAEKIKILLDEAYNNLSSDPNKAASNYMKIEFMMNDPEIKQRTIDIFNQNKEIVGRNQLLQSLYNAAVTAKEQSDTRIGELASLIKSAVNGVIQGTAASGQAGKGAAAAGSALGKASDVAKGIAGKITNKYRGIAPSKAYRQVSTQITDLSASDKEKLANYLRQQLATA